MSFAALSAPTLQSETLAKLLKEQLQPDIRRIDREGYYPEAFLRALGAAGGFSAHATEPDGLAEAVKNTTEVGRFCGSTAFLLWCQNTSVWYLTQTANESLRERYLEKVATAQIISGTAFSNPMKHYGGLEEDLKLKGVRVDGGYRVNGVLPWVSNLGLDHVFGCCIDAGYERVAAFVRIDGEQIKIGPSGHFAALEGTATYSLRFENAFIADNDILARPAEPFVNQIRPGFIMLQVGIALGVTRGVLDDIARANKRLCEINQFIKEQPDGLQEELANLEAEAERLALRQSKNGASDLRAVLQLRLDAANLVHRAAYSGLQHSGAPGFLSDSAPQRRMREALFFTLLTPSVKQLRKTLGIR